MVGKYQRKTTRQSWGEESMQQAIEAIKEKNMGWLKAANFYGVPQATLRRRVNGKNKRVKGTEKSLGRFETTFNKKTEDELVAHIKLLESRLFGLTAKETRQLAYSFAEKNNMDHRFNKEKQIAGKEWLRGFRSRHPDISLRQPEATSAARAMAFNKPQVSNYFRTLNEVLKSENIPAHNIYNMDESGLSTVQKPPKILATTGRKQVGSLTSAERGQHTTVVCCMNSIGNFVPPALIFGRKNRKDELLDNAPPGTLGLFQESGWMTCDLFVKWLTHFCSYVKPTTENKVLLLLDGHISHKSLEAVSIAKENGVVLFCFPAHCTHRLQPLDVTFFGPLKAYYNYECSIWLKNHPGRTITVYQVAELFTKSYCKAATVQNAISGFAKTGVNPFNPEVFEDYLFAPAETTDVGSSNDAERDKVQVVSEHNNDETIQENVKENQKEVGNTETKNIDDLNAANEDENIISIQENVKENLHENQKTKKVTFSELSPIPSVSDNTKKRRKICSKFLVLTCSPNINELKEKAEKKTKVESAKKAKRQVFANSSRQSRNVVIYDEISNSDDEKENRSQSDNDDEDDVACVFCNDLFKNSRSREKWIQCMVCKKWAHYECADLAPRAKIFICDICKA